MTNLIRINDEVINSDSFVKLLKLSGRFDSLIDDIVQEKLAVHSARKHGVRLTPESVQQRSDQLRRVNGLHRSVEMKRYLESMKVTPEEYEMYVTETLCFEKMMEQIVTDAKVEQFFRLNSPQFDSIDVSHIVVDSDGKAREIMAILGDEPERFAELAHEFSIADTRGHGGHVGKVLRGALRGDVEAKVFHAQKGEILGPFASPDGTCFEIFTVNDKSPASLDDDTKAEIRRVLKEQWLAAQASEHRLEVM
ncbi:peptidylprolyl isomerase [Steroidobacter sp.]|uniref:peptidylprolyl isomerase n=1 Tax=Steroidobacter sp. TaxID=1978227 RepID=UPI001A51B11B|nr:peptidylprolyl isomerase [Steroidobacter sp.]MBL8265422.1 peptidylprolyl isomerase [Steroidobacter sp.]